MFVHHKITYLHPFVLMQPIAIVEFKPFAPIVAQTFRKFDAPCLLAVIVDLIECRSFTCVDLMELAQHSRELRLAIGDMNAQKLGKALKSIVNVDFGGHRLKNDGRDMDGVIWRIYPSM